MMQLAKTLLSHKSGILSWWKQRINNGRMEGINNKIKKVTATGTNKRVAGKNEFTVSKIALAR
jgi:hypothetical protein